MKRNYLHSTLPILGMVVILTASCSKKDDSSNTPSVQIPVVTTAIVTNITTSSASCGGNVTSDGNSSVTERGVCWSLVPNPTYADHCSGAGPGTGTFTVSINSLSSNILYYVRAYAKNSAGIGYGDQKNFTTTQVFPPTVTTYSLNADYVKGYTAAVGGVITSDGGEAAMAKGVCFSTSPNPTITNNCAWSGGSDLSFACTLQIDENTVYYARAFATNSAGTGYGTEISFNSGKSFGTQFAGGYVFYNDGQGGGLVCAPSDASIFNTKLEWGCQGTSIGGTHDLLGTGPANTLAIIGGCGSQSIAARACYNYQNGGYTHWSLPSRYELLRMRNELWVTGKVSFVSDKYWSSSEKGPDMAYAVDFYTGNDNEAWKQNTLYFRPIRAF